jgi:hypothetical protein
MGARKQRADGSVYQGVFEHIEDAPIPFAALDEASETPIQTGSAKPRLTTADHSFIPQTLPPSEQETQTP